MDHVLYIILSPMPSEAPDNQYLRNVLNKGMSDQINYKT